MSKVKTRLKNILRRSLLIGVAVLITVAVIIIWRRAPGTTTVVAALIGALALVFKDTLTNLFAGLTFIWSQSFQLGDVIRLDPGIVTSMPEPYGVVTGLTPLYVQVQERDGMQIYVPNSHLSTATVWKWSGYGPLALSIRVHIGCSSSFEQARDLIVEQCMLCRRVLQEPYPRARLAGVWDGNIIVELKFWIRDPENGIRNVYSDILERLVVKMRESNIELRETSY